MLQEVGDGRLGSLKHVVVGSGRGAHGRSAGFWPIIAWGIGLGANAWDAYGRKPISEERIEREVRKLRR